MASTYGADGKLDTDRHGVPQFAGDVELLEEYVDRAWDLFYGREGQDALQIATPLHLRAQLSGTAYEAVRRLEHNKLRTRTEAGKATEDGMKLLLKTLKDSLAQEAPVRTQELFMDYFYSGQVWRRNHESMAQYIVRRELAFTKLKESSPETELSDNLKCMLLLIFSGLDGKEQQSILASVNNDYDYKKVSHALRIQFPNAASTKAVIRKDYLGVGRGGGGPNAHRPRWKGFPRKPQVFAAEMDDGEEDDDEYDDDAYYGNEELDDDEENYLAYSEDETLEALMNDVDAEDLERDDVAEAFATIAQHRGSFKKKFIKRPASGSPSSQSIPFKAQGDITFDQKAKEQRRAAVSFLKSVTQCTACGQKGHWIGDESCPKGKGKGKKPAKGKGKSSSPRKKGSSSSSSKKPSSTFFVLHDRIESDDEHFVNYVHCPDDFQAPENANAPAYDLAPTYAKLHADDVTTANDIAPAELFDPAGFYMVTPTMAVTVSPLP